MNAPQLAQGFTDAVHDGQRVFHAAMMALARPGNPQTLDEELAPPPPLSPGVAALALALCDFETTLWLDHAMASQAAVATYLRFHTGTRIVDEAAVADFALIGDPSALRSFEAFAQGTLDYPDRSTTLILQMDAVVTGEGLSLTGPGIDGEARLLAAPVPAGFATMLRHNRSRFPCGLDLLLVAKGSVTGLPRSTRVEG